MKGKRTNFIKQERRAFICRHCGKKNDDTLPSPRNHCKYCLYSFHIDEEVPGDRQSLCQGAMRPIDMEYSGKKGYSIIHICEKCGQKRINKTASDDNVDLIIQLSSHHDQYICS